MQENVLITDFISENRDEFFNWLKDYNLEDTFTNRVQFCEEHPNFIEFEYEWLSTHAENAIV